MIERVSEVDGRNHLKALVSQYYDSVKKRVGDNRKGKEKGSGKGVKVK
jgi:hypothetical protein